MLFSHINVQTSEGTFCRVEVHLFEQQLNAVIIKIIIWRRCYSVDNVMS